MASYSVRAASSCDLIERIVLVTPAGLPTVAEDLARMLDGVATRRVPIDTVVGGATRQASVRAGLAAVPNDVEAVVIHDAARPFATPELFGRVIGTLMAAGEGADGVVPALPCHDTVKRVRDGMIVETVPRDTLFLAQTPQAFRARALRRSHELAAEQDFEATDDAMLLEAAGFQVAVVTGEEANTKITTPEDLERAERLLEGGAPGLTDARIGQDA
jgi:2-C-methyl-D-erythritol 4-phosphate cytidylyltransferase / 2-C-methyl-D-erythritol 2,4-cyclodiphosphate synthase